MASTIQLPSGERVAVNKEIIRFGSDDRCEVRLIGLEPQHAQIRKVSSRWLIESLGAWTIQIQGNDASRVGWLRPGDVISLTPGGMRIVFEPKTIIETAKTLGAEPRNRSQLPRLAGTRSVKSLSPSDQRLANKSHLSEGHERPRTTPPPLPSERNDSGTSATAGPSPSGLSQAPERPRTAPPPLPSERAKSGASSSEPPPLPSSKDRFDDVRNTPVDRTATAKAAGGMTVAEASKAKIRNLTLRGVGQFWSCMVVIIVLFQMVAKLSNPHEPPRRVQDTTQPSQVPPASYGDDKLGALETMLKNPAQFRASLTQQLLQETMEKRRMTRAEAAKYLNDLRDAGIALHNMERGGRLQSSPGTEMPMPEWDHID